MQSILKKINFYLLNHSTIEIVTAAMRPSAVIDLNATSYCLANPFILYINDVK